MGSTSYPTTLNARAAIREYMTEHIPEGHRIVAETVTSTGHHWKEDFTTAGYFAVDNGENTSAHIILGMKYQGDAIIKALHEDLLTEHIGMTRKVLNALTSTTNDSALEWRRRALAHIEHRRHVTKVLRDAQKQGGVVTLAHPLNYSSIGEITEVYIDTDGQWYNTDRTCRLRKVSPVWAQIA